jgi:hypothetical protein
MFIDTFTSLSHKVSIIIIVAIAGICLIDLCYIFVIHTQQDATQRNKNVNMLFCFLLGGSNYIAILCRVVTY